jgi:drug/metabolite transporter (DMT)-like permease
LLAVILLVPTSLILGKSLFYPAPVNDYLIIFLSGALGIGIADTMFFRSLNLLGAGMSAIVDCLYSPFIIGLSTLCLNERLSIIQYVGVVMIISAVLTATQKKGRGKINRHDLVWGVFWGAMAMAVMAVGIVIVKPLLERSPLLWVTQMRLLSGALVLILILFLHPRRRRIIESLYAVKNWHYTLTGSFLGAYLSMILWLAGMKYTQASAAAALNQTSNIFIFIFASIFLKEEFNLQRVLAILLAVTGVLIVTFS